MLFAVGVLDLQADLEPAEVEARRLEFVGSVGIGAQRVDAEPVGFQFVVGNESVGRLRAPPGCKRRYADVLHRIAVGIDHAALHREFGGRRAVHDRRQIFGFTAGGESQKSQ